MGNACCSGGKAKATKSRRNSSSREFHTHKESLRYHTAHSFEDDYILENDGNEVLGSGYNGLVKVCVSKVTQERCAVKAFTKQSASASAPDAESTRQQMIQNECEIYLSMDHPNIARLMDVYEDQFSIFFVMELCSGGELYARLIAQKQYTESMAQAAVKQMLLATNYLHHHDIVHRDLKLENFLYWNEESDVLKMIDFGFSHILEGQTKPIAAACGSISYMAPEVVSQKQELITPKVDMWSLGVITFMLLAGYPPFSGNESEIMERIQAANYYMLPERWYNVSAKGRDFVEKLLVASHSRRMSADEALHHPWVTEAIAPRSSAKSVNEEWGTEVLKGIRGFAAASHFKRACLSMMAWGLAPQERAQVRDLFYMMDKEGEGYVTLEVFKDALQEHYPHQVASEEIIRLFNAMDTNHEDKIYYSDFLATMLQFRVAVHDNLLRHTFNQLDVDRTGMITVENLKHILGRSFEPDRVEEFMAEVKGDRNGRISYGDFCKYLGFDLQPDGAVTRRGRSASKEDYEEVERKLGEQDLLISKLYEQDRDIATPTSPDVSLRDEQSSPSALPKTISKLGQASGFGAAPILTGNSGGKLGGDSDEIPAIATPLSRGVSNADSRDGRETLPLDNSTLSLGGKANKLVTERIPSEGASGATSNATSALVPPPGMQLLPRDPSDLAHIQNARSTSSLRLKMKMERPPERTASGGASGGEASAPSASAPQTGEENRI